MKKLAGERKDFRIKVEITGEHLTGKKRQRLIKMFKDNFTSNIYGEGGASLKVLSIRELRD